MSRNSKKKLVAGFERLFKSKQGKSVFPRQMNKELLFEDNLPFVALQADDISIVTRGNELMQCIRIDGLNSMTSSDDNIDTVKKRLAEIIAQSGVDCSFYIHKITRPFKTDLPKIESDDFAGMLDDKWQSILEKKSLRDRTLTITIINRPSVLSRNLKGLDQLRSLLIKARGDESVQTYVNQRDARIGSLNELSAIVRATFGDMNARVLTGKSGELIGFLEAIGCGIEQPTFPSNELGVLARSVGNFRPTFRGTTIHISGGRQGHRLGRIFTIKNYPRETFAGMFDEMNLPLDMVITHSFVPISSDAASERFRRMIHQKRSLNDAGESQQIELEQGRDEVTSGLVTFGNHHMTVAVYADDEETLDKAAAEIRQIASATGTTLITEAFAGTGHYFAQWPGNATYRSRVGLITNKSFASQASLHRTPTGFLGHELPWESPITAFPTPERSALHFSFHPRGRPATESEPPAGHSFIFGPTGGGKTVLIAMLMAQARRMNARVFAFDYRRGLEWQIKMMGGAYTSLSPDTPTGLNPLFAETDPAGQAWLSDWLAALFRREDRPYAPIQTQALHNAVVQNASAPAGLRNWGEFASLFSSLDDDGDLEQRVKEWAPNGRYGWVFGNNVKDGFALDNDLMGFDLTAVLDSDQEKERTAILGYLFQRLERKLHDRKPTIIVIDEAWKALATDYFADKLANWLVTARKLNAVVLLVTQFPSQLKSSKVGDSMLQAVQSQILIANDKAKPSDYALLNLNQREMEIVLSSASFQRLALIRNDVGSVVIDLNLSELGGFLTLLGGGSTVGRTIGNDLESNPDAWRNLI